MAPIGVKELTAVIDLVEASDNGLENAIDDLGVPAARTPSVGERRCATAAVRGMNTDR